MPATNLNTNRLDFVEKENALISYCFEKGQPFFDEIRNDRLQMFVRFHVQFLDAHNQYWPNFMDRLYILCLLRTTRQQMVWQNVLKHDNVEKT